MKNFGFIISILISFSASAGRESHGFAPQFQLRCANDDAKGSRINFMIKAKPITASLVQNDEFTYFECSGNRVLTCTSVKSKLVIQLKRTNQKSTAFIFENRRVIETLDCL